MGQVNAENTSPRYGYRDVTDVLRARIETGVCAPGSQLPTGAALTEEFNVARDTARRALQSLVDLGLIAVFQGRGSHSLSFIALDEATNVRRAYAGISVKLDGKAFAANSFSTKLRALRGLAQYGVERGFFESSPLRRVKVPRRRVSPVVDRRGVANSSQAAALFAAVPQCGRTGRRLVAFYKTIYFAGLRPGEVLALRQHDCHLPETGWGELAFEESTPYAGARWTNDGTAPA